MSSTGNIQTTAHLNISNSDNETNDFNKICEIVNKQLDQRSDYNELLDKGIIKSKPVHVSPSLQQLQSQIKFQKTGYQLDKKLENRPTITDLYDHHILENSPLSNLAPSLQSKKKYLQFLQTQSQLLQKLDNRPTLSQLIDSSIFKDNFMFLNQFEYHQSKSYSSTPSIPMRSSNNDIDDIEEDIYDLESFDQISEEEMTLSYLSSLSNTPPLPTSNLSTSPSNHSTISSSPSFLSASDLLLGPRYNSFDETVKIMNFKLENRINREILLQNGIIKSTLEIAPSIQAKQSLLKFQSISNSIDNKLEKIFQTNNCIDKTICNNTNNQNNESTCHLLSGTANSNYLINTSNLNYKIENRPSFEDLINYNILKDPTLYNQKNHLKFIQTRNRLNSKVESRPPIDLLIKNNILIQNHNTTITKTQLQDKLINRPDKEFLLQNNILTSHITTNTEIQFSYDDDDMKNDV